MSTPQPPPSDRIGATPSIGPSKSEEQKMGTPMETSFKEYMAKAPAAPQGSQMAQISPFDLAQGGALPAPSYDNLLSLANNTGVLLGGIQNQLSYPNLKVNDAHKRLLDNKLKESHALLQAASQKLGVEQIPETDLTGKNPIERFLSLVTDGQSQLYGARKQLQDLKSKGDQLSPGDMLLIQLKMNKAQQLLEFSSVVLTNAVSSFKMLMQIQL